MYSKGQMQLLHLECTNSFSINQAESTNNLNTANIGLFTRSDTTTVHQPSVTGIITHKQNYYLSCDKLKIITWNIHHGLDWLMRYTLTEIADYLNEKNTDIICLQEVNTSFVYLPDHGLISQATFIATYIGYNCYYYNNLAILTRAPIIRELEPIQINPWQHKSRFLGQIIGCVVNINGMEIKIYNCHLPNDISGFGQYHGIADTNGLLSRILDDTYNKYPVIIAGDFNSIELFSSIRTLKKLTNNGTCNHPSYPILLPLMQLDYIFTNSDWINGFDIINSSANYNCNLSDHYPITATINLPHK
jgi:endonuclease/exonuclease/phosphatase family metal-dependent hydrolase